MNKGILKLIIFIIPIIIGMGLAEWALRSLPNSYTVKYQQIEEKAAEIEMLILGHSHMFFGINPAYLDIPTYNMAHVGQSYTYDLMILDHLHLKNLKTIVLPVDYFSLYREEQRVDELDHAYRVYYGLSIKGFTLEITSFPPRYNLRRLYTYFKKSELDFNQTPYGFGTDFSEKSQVDIVKSAQKTATHHRTNRTNFYPPSLESFKTLLEKDHLNIILVTPPVHSEYLKWIDIEKLEAAKSYAREQARNYLHIHYIDAHKMDVFTNDDFYDPDHLNHTGAIKMSKQLNNWMNEHLPQ